MGLFYVNSLKFINIADFLHKMQAEVLDNDKTVNPYTPTPATPQTGLSNTSTKTISH